MKYRVTLQQIDGQKTIQLPENVSAQDFTDWLNKKPNAKNIEVVDIGEKWTSADLDF